MKNIMKFKKAGINIKQVAPNQITINTRYGVAFQSYDSIVAFIDYESNQTYLGKNWDYSRTTMKYLGQWLGKNAKEIRNAIKNGTYIIDEEL